MTWDFQRLRSRLPGILHLLAALCAASPAFAWVYPEHRDIAVLAVRGLDPAHQAVFDQLWRDARVGDEGRLCAEGADAQQGLAPSCLDWAALPGIAGDHSCSSAEMIETVRSSDWILTVADVAAQLKVDLARIPITEPPPPSGSGTNRLETARRLLASETHRAERRNALRTADARLQRADSQYALRADANLAHFLLPRPDTKLDPNAYGEMTFRSGSPLNAMGIYAWYHLGALQKARRLADERLSVEERRALARSVLSDEAFALHFLEDIYAAGHVAGSWGDVSQRKGTHDYYNENGLEVFRWTQGDSTMVLMGDAHMRPEDAARAAEAVRTSLAQVLDVASGVSRAVELPQESTSVAKPEDFDICKSATFPDRDDRVGSGLQAQRSALREVLMPTPVPGLGPGPGAQPRARSEVGTFVGLAAAIEGRGLDGGFETSQTDNGWMPGLDLGFRMGVGLEGALGDAGDGRVFVQLGYHADGASTTKYSVLAPGAVEGSLTAAIPAREALSFRLRMPYYLIPGDLLLLSPMYFSNREKYTELAVIASNGGLLGWQSGYSTPIGRFQFVAGREIGVNWYGIGRTQQLLVPPDEASVIGRVIDFESVYFDLPLVEYRPYRSFSANQSSSLVVQLFVGADVPTDDSLQAPAGAPPADLDTVWSLGLRLVFDWRYYLSTND